jgi:hypothetical protein
MSLTLGFHVVFILLTLFFLVLCALLVAELEKHTLILTKKCQKNLAFPSFHDVLAFDKLYFPLYLHNLFSELGSTLWCCIEAMSELAETTEDLYTAKTLLRTGWSISKV